jgi:hypothetical protein
LRLFGKNPAGIRIASKSSAALQPARRLDRSIGQDAVGAGALEAD